MTITVGLSISVEIENGERKSIQEVTVSAGEVVVKPSVCTCSQLHSAAAMSKRNRNWLIFFIGMSPSMDCGEDRLLII